jgi:hypothetical protein
MKNTFLWLLFAVTISNAQTENDSIPKQLDEITIQAAARAITNKNGNLKIDVANSIYKSVPNAIDLLSKLPKIQVSSDRENVTIVGKGNALIYIDNQKVGMNDLNSLSVGDIKNIEIINNPSAKYEAEGRAVILITRKRNRKEGFEATISETAMFKKKFNNYAGLNASFKTGKTEFKANAEYNDLNPWESNGINYEIPSAGIAANYRVAGFTDRKQYIFGGGIFHQVNEDDYVSLTVSDRIRNDDFAFDTNTFNSQPLLSEGIQTLGSNKAGKNFFNSFFNYNNKIKSIDAVFFGGLQYSKFTDGSAIASFNNYNNSQFGLFQNLAQDLDVSVFSGRADFEKKFGDEIKWETGALFSSANAQTKLRLFDYEQSQLTHSDYRLKEKNTSAYATLSGTVKKISWTAGIRMENTDINGEYKLGTNPPLLKNYTNWFPKVELDYAIDSSKTITVDYGKSIDRPNYSSIGSGVTYINPYFAFASNINLNPSITEAVSAVFQYKDKSLRVAGYQSSDVVNYSFTYDDADNLLIFKPENFKRESGYEVELTLPFKRGIWSSTNMLNGYLTKLEDPSAVVKSVKPYLYYYTNHIFTFKKEWTLSFTGWGLTRQQTGIYDKKGFYIVDVGVSKTFFKNLSGTLSANNVFRNTTYGENFNLSGVNSRAKYYTDTYDYSLSLKYTFGKIKDAAYRQKEIEETTRIK